MTKPIRTEADYEAALGRIAELMDAREGTPEGDELDVLSVLVERFEEERFPVEAPTPLAAIRFRMEQENLSPRDLEPCIGARARIRGDVGCASSFPRYDPGPESASRHSR